MCSDCAYRHRAQMLLYYAHYNMHFSGFKIKQVKVAGVWFRGALAWFAVLALILMLYVALGPAPRVPAAK